MYGHSYYGTQKRPAASQEEDNRNEGRAPRQHEVDVVGGLSRDQEREGNFREPEQHYYATSSSDMQLSSPPSTNMSADSPSPDQTGRSSPGRTPVDRLVKKLSKHNLQLGSRSRVQSQPPPQPFHQPGSSSTYSSAPWPKIEIETQPGQSGPTGPYGRLTSWGPPPILDAGEPIEVDDEEQEEALDIKKLNFRRIRRQPSGLGMRHSAGSTSRSAESRLEQMIANETQCRVRKDPLSSKASSTSFQPAAIIAAEPVTIEVDPEFALPNWDTTLEVDPAYLNNNDELNADESVSLEDSRLALRDAAGPSGIRKYSAGGVQLRYRLSVDAALRCQNVVRSRPRMRKRDKSRFSSASSSAVTSTVSSPVIAPTRLPPS